MKHWYDLIETVVKMFFLGGFNHLTSVSVQIWKESPLTFWLSGGGALILGTRNGTSMLIAQRPRLIYPIDGHGHGAGEGRLPI